jgi:hypothetical protein
MAAAAVCALKPMNFLRVTESVIAFLLISAISYTEPRRFQLIGCAFMRLL